MLHDGRFDPVSGWRSSSARASTCSARRRPSTGCSPSAPSCAPIAGLRRMVSAGEPLNPEVIRVFREQVGLTIHDGYGQTETGAVTGMRPGDDDPARDGSMGRPLPGVEARIEEGELQVKPATRAHLLQPLPRRRALRRASGGGPGTRCGRGRGRLPLVRGPRRRHHRHGRLPGRPVRGRVGAASAIRPSPRRPRSPRPTPSAGRSCGRSWSCATGEPSDALAARAPGARQGRDRALQVPADRRVRRRAARRRSSGKIRRSALRNPPRAAS